MNNKQRKQLKELKQSVQYVRDDVEIMRDDEQEKLDNMPESLLGTEKEDHYNNSILWLNDIIEKLDDAIAEFDEEGWV